MLNEGELSIYHINRGRASIVRELSPSKIKHAAREYFVLHRSRKTVGMTLGTDSCYSAKTCTGRNR